MSLYTFLLLLQLPPFPSSCDVTRFRELLHNDIQCRTIPAEGNGTSFILALWHEKALLFLQTASLGPLLSPRYFFSLQNSRGDINTHIRERGLRRGREGSRRLTIWISFSYLQRISSPSDIAVLPIFRIPSLIVLRPTQRVARAGFSNLLARCFCAILLHRAILPVNLFPRLYPRSSASRDQHVSRSIFNSRGIVHYFSQ